MTPVPPLAFAVLVWGAVALVLVAFLYVAAVLVRGASG